MKTLIIIEESPFSEIKTITIVECESYRIYKNPPTASYHTLHVVRKNGTGHTWIHMTEVHEVVWRKGELNS